MLGVYVFEAYLTSFFVANMVVSVFFYRHPELLIPAHTLDVRHCQNTSICPLGWPNLSAGILAEQHTESVQADLSRFPFQAFGAKDELLGELAV